MIPWCLWSPPMFCGDLSAIICLSRNGPAVDFTVAKERGEE